MTKRNGFTLVEIIVYLGLLSITVGGLLVVSYGIIDGSAKLERKASIEEEGAFLIRKLDWAMTGATAISVLTPDTLQITRSGLPPSENPLILNLNAQNLNLARGAGTPVTLNSASVRVTALVFTSIPAVGSKPAGAQIHLVLSNLSQSQTFDIVRYLKQ